MSNTTLPDTAIYGIGSADAAFANLEPALKVFYSDQQIRNQCYEEHPFLGIIPKKEDVTGLVYPVPLIVSPEAGASHTFATAQGYASSFKPVSFQVQLANDYIVSTIATKAMRASAGNAGAFLDVAKAKIDSALSVGARRLSYQLFHNSSGCVGRIASINGSGVVTLTNRSDVVAFEVGQVYFVSTSAAPTSSSNLLGVVEATDTGYVIGVDRAAGTVTFSKTRTGSAQDPGNSGTAWAANHYLYRAGDICLGANGLDDLIPSSTPGVLHGLTRTTDRQRLAGTYVDGSALSITEALTNLAVRIAEAGIGMASHCFMTYTSYAALLNEVGAKVQYCKEAASGAGGQQLALSYEGLTLLTPSGAVKVLPDRDCLSATAFMVDMRHLQLLSMGPAIGILSNDGLTWLRQAAADGAEVRVGGYFQPITDAPAAHGRTLLAV
jgi:hypothetical protein